MPASRPATASAAAVSIDMAPCSKSRNSQSKPAVRIALAISTERATRMPNPSDTSPFSSRCRAGFWIASIVTLQTYFAERLLPFRLDAEKFGDLGEPRALLLVGGCE